MIRACVALALLLALSHASCSDDSSGARDSGPPGGDGQLTCPKDFPSNIDGVCMQAPSAESQRTQCGEIVEDCDTTGKTAPNLACITGAAPKAPQGPATVTLAGFVDVFSSGPDADSIKVQIFDAADLLKELLADQTAGKLTKHYFPTTVSPLGEDTVSLVWTDKTKLPEDPTRGIARACPEDNKLKLPCIVPELDCGPTKIRCDLDGDEYCHNDKCIQRLRWETRYKIKDIPTNRYLAIRTLGTKGFDDGTWGVMVQFNVYLRADAKACAAGQFNDCINKDGAYELEVNALSKADYSTIPITAGLSGGIPEGHGAIAGEVHDCDDVKLSGFQVGTTPTPTVMTYFNGNPVKTLPDLTRLDGTNIDGLFGALDITPGPVTVNAAGLVGGKTLSAGALQLAVLPDSVTVVTFEGRKPAP